MNFSFFTVFLKNRNIISKIKRSKVTDYAVLSKCLNRVPTGQGKVREIRIVFKVREKSGNSVKWSGKLENLQKSRKSQGILKSCLLNHSKIEQTNMR